ncbi:MAG: hypothetical protein WD872_06515 [Pirellulaceae bacterium]
MPKLRRRLKAASHALCLVLIALAGLATAAEPAKEFAWPAYGKCLVCLDDYCRKPWPCLPHAICGQCCDDYCRKPIPLLPCPAPSCCPDGYCPKPLPCPPSPLWSRWLICPPACETGVPSKPAAIGLRPKLP